MFNKTNGDLISLNSNENLSEVTIRLESFAKLNLKDELISVSVSNIESTLHMDSVMLLADFVTDEDTDYVPPTHILLNNVSMTLIDDKVSVPPLGLNIPLLFIKRDKSNQMNIIPLKTSESSENFVQIYIIVLKN